jgi:hypothetical protein
MDDDNFGVKGNSLGEPRKKCRQLWQMRVHLGVIPASPINESNI